MRVDWLYLRAFKNLNNFEVDFDLSSERQVVVGRNSVGKSNVLEALAWIFRDLDLEEDSEFEYKIIYRCNGAYIKIETLENYKVTKGKKLYPRKYYWVNEWNADAAPKNVDYIELKQTEFFKKNRPLVKRKEKQINSERLLPHYVFGYYSGVSERFNEAFHKHEERYYDEQKKGEEAALRSMFLAKPHHSQFSLLSFFASYDKSTREFLEKEFNIEKLKSVLFLLQEPYWYKSRRAALERDKKDRRFWGAGGKVRPFLESLYDNSFAPMSGSLRKNISIGQTKTVEKRYCFLKDQEALDKLAEGLESKEVFSRLESAIFSDLLSLDGEDLKINLKLKGLDKPITFKEMSEGEQQLLTIIGLMRFTAQNESLFLLDEPDTHLNPAWCLDLLDNLRKYGVNPDNSQIIITTHSPLTFAGLDKNEVVIMDRAKDGFIRSEHPAHAPRGMGFQAILTSSFFALRSTLDRETLKNLDRKRYLALKKDLSPEEEHELIKLDEELGKLDFSKATRDPLYLEFIRAMTEAQVDNPKIAKPILDSDERKIREDIARDIAEKISRKKREAT
jgi:predicted ATPase